MALGRIGGCIRMACMACMACRVGAKRHLLSEDVVKLQEFQQRKQAVAHQVSGSESHYLEVFNRKLKKNEIILKDELKLLLHLCQSTARGAIYRYHEDNSNVAFGEFKFGPLFMRLCYELGLEEMFAATLTDKDMRGFFSDSTSFNIAIDMLFMKGLYESSLDVLRDMKNQGVPFNKDTFTLATGTCYKLNTPESYRICTALIEEEQTKGHIMPRHAYCFTVALPLRQNDVEKAQSMFCQIMSTDSRICQYLKVLILAMAGAVKESLSVLTLALGSSSHPAAIRTGSGGPGASSERGQSSDGESGAGSVPPPAGRSGESTKRGRDVVSYPHGEEEDAHGDNGRETDQPEDSEASAVHSVVRVNGTRCISQRV